MTSSKMPEFSDAELKSLSVWRMPDVPTGTVKTANIFEPVSKSASKTSRLSYDNQESLSMGHISNRCLDTDAITLIFESVSGTSPKKSAFSEAELESLSVWRMPDISSGNKVSANFLEAIPLSVLTVDDIVLMQKQAYDEAFEQGKKEGYSEGHSVGLTDGFNEGFTDGFNKGSLQGYEENLHILQAKVADFNLIFESLSEPFKNLDTQVEQELINIATTLATQVIYREIKIDPKLILAIVRAAIKALPLSVQKISIHLHPEDAELVRSAFELDEQSSVWTVIEDPLITRGGCKVDTDISYIDVTVENRVAIVIASLLGNEQGQGKDL